MNYRSYAKKSDFWWWYHALSRAPLTVSITPEKLLKIYTFSLLLSLLRSLILGQPRPPCTRIIGNSNLNSLSTYPIRAKFTHIWTIASRSIASRLVGCAVTNNCSAKGNKYCSSSAWQTPVPKKIRNYQSPARTPDSTPKLSNTFKHLSHK